MPVRGVGQGGLLLPAHSFAPQERALLVLVYAQGRGPRTYKTPLNEEKGHRTEEGRGRGGTPDRVYLILRERPPSNFSLGTARRLCAGSWEVCLPPSLW